MSLSTINFDNITKQSIPLSIHIVFILFYIFFVNILICMPCLCLHSYIYIFVRIWILFDIKEQIENTNITTAAMKMIKETWKQTMKMNEKTHQYHSIYRGKKI